jgi:hypothetical protein
VRRIIEKTMTTARIKRIIPNPMYMTNSFTLVVCDPDFAGHL